MAGRSFGASQRWRPPEHLPIVVEEFPDAVVRCRSRRLEAGDLHDIQNLAAPIRFIEPEQSTRYGAHMLAREIVAGQDTQAHHRYRLPADLQRLRDIGPVLLK